VAKGATDLELQLFLHRCKNMGLDPLKPGQIHFIKFGNTPGSIVVGIDGLRAKAMSTGKLSGIKRGILRNQRGECVGAWAEIYRQDWNHPAREEVNLAEYNTGKNLWARMPETMIKKVAESQALRMAFPDELGGAYSHEEIATLEPRMVETQSISEEKKSRREELVDLAQAYKLDLKSIAQVMESKFKVKNSDELTEDQFDELKAILVA